MAQKTMLINSTAYEARVAVLDQGTLSEFFAERHRKRTIVGNIYKGKVVKVLPGMQSAFIDIGLHKAAFLHVADILSEMPLEELQFTGDELSDDSLDTLDFDSIENLPTPQSMAAIEELLTEGQEIVVQVSRDATGDKGARLTMHLSLPGRYLVFMPNYEHIGVSRKIEDGAERDKLRDILKDIVPANAGLIARTVSKGQDREKLSGDRDYLVRMWAKVQRRAEQAHAPAALYEEDNLIFRLLRDVVTDDIDEIIIDNERDYASILEYSRDYYPALKTKITQYSRDKALFETYNVEIEVNKLLDRKIWLRSGGYIVIDQAEALTVIDVNTGKFVGKRNFEETIVRTNIEAAWEIAHQLRLRNIGGIIIVDFIDMADVKSQESVLTLLDNLLKEDRARASVMNITPLGLVEITRKRAQESITKILTEPCPYCEGRGFIKSRLTVCYDILRHLKRIGLENKGKTIIIEVHNEVADLLLSNEQETIEELEKEFNITLQVMFRNNFHVTHYEVIPTEKRG